MKASILGILLGFLKQKLFFASAKKKEIETFRWQKFYIAYKLTKNSSLTSDSINLRILTRCPFISTVAAPILVLGIP